MRPIELEHEERVRQLAAPIFDDQGSPTISPDSALALTRWHLDIEEIEVNNTDDEILQMWESETSAASADDINAGALERVLNRIKQET